MSRTHQQVGRGFARVDEEGDVGGQVERQCHHVDEDSDPQTHVRAVAGEEGRRQGDAAERKDGGDASVGAQVSGLYVGSLHF